MIDARRGRTVIRLQKLKRAPNNTSFADCLSLDLLLLVREQGSVVEDGCKILEKEYCKIIHGGSVFLHGFSLIEVERASPW